MTELDVSRRPKYGYRGYLYCQIEKEDECLKGKYVVNAQNVTRFYKLHSDTCMR